MIDSIILMDHEPSITPYDAHPCIEGCEGCTWVADFKSDVPTWQQYIKHLEDLSLRIFVWSPQHGAELWKLIPSVMNATPGEEEQWLAEALQKLADKNKPLVDHIYFLATEKEMTL